MTAIGDWSGYSIGWFSRQADLHRMPPWCPGTSTSPISALGSGGKWPSFHRASARATPTVRSAQSSTGCPRPVAPSRLSPRFHRGRQRTVRRGHQGVHRRHRPRGFTALERVCTRPGRLRLEGDPTPVLGHGQPQWHDHGPVRGLRLLHGVRARSRRAASMWSSRTTTTLPTRTACPSATPGTGTTSSSSSDAGDRRDLLPASGQGPRPCPRRTRHHSVA